MKTCSTCKEEKPADAFYIQWRPRKQSTELMSFCKVCHIAGVSRRRRERRATEAAAAAEAAA